MLDRRQFIKGAMAAVASMALPTAIFESPEIMSVLADSNTLTITLPKAFDGYHFRIWVKAANNPDAIWRQYVQKIEAGSVTINTETGETLVANPSIEGDHYV